MNANNSDKRTTLEILPNLDTTTFDIPVKKIHDGPDVDFFLRSLAYRDIMTFILQLNRAMVPRKIDNGSDVRQWKLTSDNVTRSAGISKMNSMIYQLRDLIKQAPPDTGPRRFGNVSYRKWYHMVEDRVPTLLRDILPPSMHRALPEIEAYLLGSFGSPQRLDYGTGHELSYLAFLGGLWKVKFFAQRDSGDGERAIIFGLFEPYLMLVRDLIKTYTLEPAGSHGVWGLDDNSFLPYIFGSAQLCPAIDEHDNTPLEGSIPNAPEPSSVTKLNLVEKERHSNLYFSAIAFIYEVKKGPFWEHSPILYDISGIKDGWGKINKGMIKMYNAEVLSKFPVVQHFPFGSLFRWERDPEAKAPTTTAHTANQPLRNAMDTSGPQTMRPGAIPQPGVGTQAPWATNRPPPPAGMVDGITRAPWVSKSGVTTTSSARSGPFRGGGPSSNPRSHPPAPG